MADNIMSKAATMEIPINSNGDTGTLPEDDSLEQVRHASFHLTDETSQYFTHDATFSSVSAF